MSESLRISRHSLQVGLQVCGTLVVVGAIILVLDVRTALNQLANISPVILFLSLSIALSVPLSTSMRYYLGAGRFDDITLFDSIRAGYVGVMYSMILPSSLGGDVLRMEMMHRGSESSRKRILIGIILDRAWGLGGLGLILLCSMIFITPPYEYLPWFIATGLGSLFVAYFVHIGKTRRIKVESPLVTLLIFIIGSLITGLITIILTITLAIGLGVGWSDAFVLFSVMPIIWIISIIPVTIGGFGLREGGMVLLLSLYGWTEELALALGIATSVVLLLASLIGLPFQWYQTSSAITSEE